MTGTNLITALKQNPAFLNEKYEKTDNRIGFFGRKIFLSHDKSGWSIIKLNPFQLIFRNVFGFYKSTHLTKIFKNLSKEKQMEAAALPFYSRVTQIWTEKYTKWVGNSPVGNANVFCFGERHGDQAYREATQQFINKNYREGDVVLIEGYKAGHFLVRPQDIPLTQKLKENCLVMGWEPQNIAELNQCGNGLHKAKYQELLALIEQFKTTFPENCHFDQTKISLLSNRLEAIGDKILELNKYYQSKNPTVLNVKAFFSNILQKVIDQKFPQPEACVLFAITTIISELEKMQEKARYQNLSTEANASVLKNVSLRNPSLINEISKFRKEGRRVFVIGGLAHFIQTNYTDENQVKKELAKHQFVVLGRRQELDKFAKLNKEMSSTS